MRRLLPLIRLQQLFPSTRGLTAAEAIGRRQEYGPNDILEGPRHPWWDLARETAKDPMIWFFAGTSGLYGLAGQHAEALTLLGAILPLLGMDVYLHRRTQASTEGLKSRLASQATVLRDGTTVTIPSVDVVPGDLAFVSTGEPLPADGVVLAGKALQVDESALTGEAYPVVKRPLDSRPFDGAELLVDEEHWGFAGTRVLTGSAQLRVVFTGGETSYGEIVRSAVHGTHESTPLQRAIRDLVQILLVAAVVLCLLLAGVRLYQGHGWLDAVVSAVTLATAAIPEEFPVVFTFFLGVGVFRLAKRQALVRRAVSVENIGRVSCICSDKTGTITEGRLELTHRLPAAGISDERLLVLARLAARRESGDPMDDAILGAAEASGIPRISHERLATFPFTEDRKRETAVVCGEGGLALAATEGEAEVVLAMTALSAHERVEWEHQIARLAEGGHKVIAVASRRIEHAVGALVEPDRGYDLAGLLAFEDPVREGVADAVAACRKSGIHAIMVTGDHPLTARAVAREVGLGGGAERLILGDELEGLVSGGRGRELRQVGVIARAKPAQKLLLVRSLQEAGEIVAVTGDGVNDVPALQAADIGVAMGERGTRSAREVAAIVLLDDNFRTIVRAIGEGRQLFRNLQLSFEYLLMIHIPLVLTAALIPLAGYPLLYLPVHVVWLEIVIHPTAMLVFQELPATESLAMARPRGPARFFNFREWAVIVSVGAVISVLVAGGYLRSVGGDGNVAHGRAMALATLTFASAAVTATLSRLRTRSSRLIPLGTVAGSIILIQTPVFARVLHLQSLHRDDWGLAALAALVVACLPLLADALTGSERDERTV